MKKVLLFCLLLPITYIYPQYSIQSQYFLQPDKLIGYVDSCAQFWMKVHDDTYGGFYSSVGKTGNVLDYNHKAMLSQARNAYGFVRAYMMTGNNEYLNMARSALDFMYSYQWDNTYGGWFGSTSRTGTNPSTSNKTAFDQHYALLGISAFFEATGSQNDWTKLEEGYNYIEDHLWDDDASSYGYYDQVPRAGDNAYGKSFNATVDAVTTHLYNLYLMTNDERYKTRLLEMKNNMIDHLIGSMSGSVIGFAEEYNSDWSINTSHSNTNRTIMGHVLKTAWCLARIYRIDENEDYLDAAKFLVQDVLDKGYDYEYGGPYKDYNRLTGEMYMYGAYDIAKAWWQMEQAVTSGLLLYEITREDKYLQMADESLNFFMTYFVDHDNGEVYADRARTGGRVRYSGGYWDENKGSDWKAGYHSIETGYYAYLYGKMMLNNEPVTLYYNYDPVSSERVIRMNPLAVDFSNLIIENITLDGNDYTNFDKDNRLLTLPANIGGEFAVTYKLTNPTSIDGEGEDLIREFALAGNYPNPFNPATTISFSLPSNAHVEIFVYNSLGQQVAKLLDEELSRGQHNVKWNASNQSSGVYFYRVNADNVTKIGKCILMK